MWLCYQNWEIWDMWWPCLFNRTTAAPWPPPGLVSSTCPDKQEGRLLRTSFPHFLTLAGNPSLQAMKLQWCYWNWRKLAGNPSLTASHDIAVIFFDLLKTRRKSLDLPVSSEPHKIPLQLATQYWVTVYQKWNVSVFLYIFKINDKKRWLTCSELYGISG